MSKITDLIKKQKEFSFSFEVTPGLKEDDVDHLKIEPLFYSITWHARTHKNKDLNIGPLEMARNLKKKGKNVLLHLSCDLLRKAFLDEMLKMLLKNDIHDLFVIFGEQFDSTLSDFGTTLALIKYIREKTGHSFCIGVAGMPDCTDQKLQDLKGKIDAGADFVLTQAFFEPKLYKLFLDRCRKIGITVPIIPGIFYFETSKELTSFANMCAIKLSDELTGRIRKDEKSLNGKNVTKDLIDFINKDWFHHFHFFTMNKLDIVSTFINEKLFSTYL